MAVQFVDHYNAALSTTATNTVEAITLTNAAGASPIGSAGPFTTLQIQTIGNDGFTVKSNKTFENTLLASLSRTTAATSPNQQNDSNVGVILYVNVTSIVAGPGLGIQPQLYYVDPASGVSYMAVQLPKITAVGMYVFGARPGPAVTNFSQLALPRTWYVQVQVSDATAYTYSIGSSTTF